MYGMWWPQPYLFRRTSWAGPASVYLRPPNIGASTRYVQDAKKMSKEDPKAFAAVKARRRKTLAEVQIFLDRLRTLVYIGRHEAH